MTSPAPDEETSTPARGLDRLTISFWRFTRYGLVVTLVTVGLSWPYLWLRYFVFS